MTPIFEDDIYSPGEENKDDKKLVVAFYIRPVLNEFKSKEEGRKIFDPIEYIHIITPGQRDDVNTEVTDQYRTRFVERYERWKAKVAEPTSGQPLTEVPWLSVTQVAELQSLNIKTLEQLADLPDVITQKFMGGYEMRTKAQRYVKAGQDAAPELILEGKLKERDEQIAELQTQVAALIAANKAAAAKAPAKV